MSEETPEAARASVEQLIKLCHERAAQHGISENLSVREYIAAHVGAMWSEFDAIRPTLEKMISHLPEPPWTPKKLRKV
jgi:DNA polymerase III delta subunit